MKSESHTIWLTTLCALLAIYLGGFFWVRASCCRPPGGKLFIRGSDRLVDDVGQKFYRPVFWIDEKLFGEKFVEADW